MRRILGALGIAITFALVAASTASAGGWSVATAVDRPDGVQAGDEFTIAFAIRQHGVSPMDGLEPTFTFINEASGERVVADAVPSGDEGQYVVTATLPEQGSWNWMIDAFGVHAMAPFDVGTGAVSASASTTSTITGQPIVMMLLGAGVAMGLAATGVVTAHRWWRPMNKRARMSHSCPLTH